MNSKRILVPVDFTELSEKVVEQAVAIGKKTNLPITLLHIVTKSADISEKSDLLNKLTVETAKKYSISCVGKIREGSIFKEIPEEAEDESYELMIIGTHGVRGLKQKLLGADILKLISKVPMASLVVQDVSPLKESFKKIVLPVASHESYINVIKAACFFGRYYGSEIHIYSIEKPGYEWPDAMRKNVEVAKTAFEDSGVSYIRTREKQTVLSIGYARQTLKYAESINADLIAIMSISSDEYFYFAQQDKENLLTSDIGIPVICSRHTEKY